MLTKWDMAARYYVKQDTNGWTVHDSTTDLPAEVNGFIQSGLSIDDADDLSDLLNRLDIEQSAILSADATNEAGNPATSPADDKYQPRRTSDISIAVSGFDFAP